MTAEEGLSAPAAMPHGSSGRAPCARTMAGAQPTSAATLDARRKSRRVSIIEWWRGD
jgi:hypothetical protein